jgi:tetratricopeptide (TPR) repeat protein
MKLTTLKLCLLLVVVLFYAGNVSAQVTWPSPELGQMYHNAQEYVAAGNFKDAVITYKQAIKLAPDIMILYRDLADALYRSGNYDDAAKVLTPLFVKQGTDDKCYKLLAQIFIAQKDVKHAILTLREGLEKFPASGDLYHEIGIAYQDENKKESALNAWLDGISKAPGFSENYFDAANIYLNSEKVFWGLVYGEMFLAMTHDTAHDDELKNGIFKAYKTMFDDVVKDEVPEFGKPSEPSTVSTFEGAVKKIFLLLTPVVSDGITTENLTMVRTRFLMEWEREYNKKYPCSLFSYQDKIIRSGHFDMYNEWLFGKAESATEYKAWNEFHEGDMMRFLQWKNTNEFTPAANEFYNDKDVNGLFDKKKK